MFICGKGGTGKTYYAKKLLTDLNYDFCISSSSNDPFQDYLGQKAIILDDLRDKSFELDDLLKILDNNTASSMRSRFMNKVFNGEMIIITTPMPLAFWYREYRYNAFDTLEQLYRRISCYVEVTKTEVIVYDEGVDEHGKPKGEGRVYRNELAELEKVQRTKTDFKSMFDRLCKDPGFPDVPVQTKIKL